MWGLDRKAYLGLHATNPLHLEGFCKVHSQRSFSLALSLSLFSLCWLRRHKALWDTSYSLLYLDDIHASRRHPNYINADLIRTLHFHRIPALVFCNFVHQQADRFAPNTTQLHLQGNLAHAWQVWHATPHIFHIATNESLFALFENAIPSAENAAYGMRFSWDVS